MASTISFDVIARDRASATFSKISKSSDGLGGKLGKFSKVAAIGMGGLATALGAVGLSGIKTAAANEQAQIAFTTMLGSAKKARSFLGELQQFAAKTPFEFPELQTAASSLISAGVNAKKVIPIMTTLGNVTSGMGTGAEGVKRATIALQQMQAAGRITGEDLNQLRDAGIPVYDLLAKATGKSKAEVVKLAQAGKLGKTELDKMMKALETGKGLERFNGLMDKQSKSLTGMASTLKDTFSQGLATALAPAIPTINKMIGGLTRVIAVGMPRIAAALNSSQLKEFFRGISQFATTVVIPAFQRVQAAFQSTGSGAGRTGQALAQFKANFSSVFASVVSISQSVSTFAQAFWTRYGDLITKFGIGTLRNLLTTVRGVMNVITGIFKTVAAVLHGDWAGAWAGIKQITKGATQIIRGAVGQLWNQLRTLFAAGGRALLDLMQAALSGLVKATRNGIKNVIQFYISLPSKIMHAIGDLSHLLYDAGKAVIQGLIDGIGDGAKKLVKKLGDVTKLIPMHKGPLEKDRGLLRPAGKAIMDGLLAGIEDRKMSVARALDRITGMFEKLRDKVASLKDTRAGFKSTFSADSIFGADLSDGGGIANLIAMQKSQAFRARRLKADIQRLTAMGLSKSLIAQLQSAGSSGADQLHALAGGSSSQIKLLNSLNKQTESTLQSAGMLAGNYERGGNIDRDIARAQKQSHLLYQILLELRRVKDEETIVKIDAEGIIRIIKKRNQRKGVSSAGI